MVDDIAACFCQMQLRKNARTDSGVLARVNRERLQTLLTETKEKGGDSSRYAESLKGKIKGEALARTCSVSLNSCKKLRGPKILFVTITTRLLCDLMNNAVLCIFALHRRR